MLLNIYSFLDKKLIESSEFDMSSLTDVKVNHKIIAEHFVKMKKYHFVPTAYTKSTAEIAATTKKPFKQKGTGQARQGTTIAAQHKGGVKIFGPRGLKASISLPKKEVRLVKKMLIKLAIEQNKLFVVSDCVVPSCKTKNTLSTMNAFGVKRGHVVVLHDNEVTENNILSARNVHFFSYSRVSDFTVHSLMKSDTVIVTKSAINKLIEA